MPGLKHAFCAIILLAGAGAGWGAAAQPQMAARQCFRMSEMQGWRAAPDARSFYMRVRNREVWRVDLAQACPALRRPATHLITRPVNDLICSAVEFDLKVADSGPGAIVTPCIVSGFTKLSPEDAKALPKNVRP